MKYRLKGVLCALFMLFFQTAPAADGEILRVGTTFNTPPFVMQGAGKRLFGFDIVLMNHLCKQMGRQCRFVMMPFSKLLPAVQKGEVDMAINAIIITPERTKNVLFTLPYLTSEYRFLTLSSRQPFPESPTVPANQRIGVLTGSAFIAELQAAGVTAPQIDTFSRIDALVDALTNGNIDLAVMDSHAAEHWSLLSSGVIQMLWTPKPVGGGFGIAVRPDAPELRDALNEALHNFLNSPDFQREYNKYLMRF